MYKLGIICTLKYSFQYISIQGGFTMGWFTDKNGNIAGKVDDDKRIYDKNGNYTSKMVGNEVRGKDGTYLGKVNDDGRVYDRDGYYAGKVRSDGWVEDKDGHLQYKL